MTTDAWGSQSSLPENYDGVLGLIAVAPENGQAVRNAFRIRNYLYFVKEHSTYVTADDGQNEPSGWTVNEVSSVVGTPSPRGVGLGDEWAVIASQSGLYYFDGGALNEQNKLSKEIQPTWDRINWVAGQTIIVKVDTTRKRVYIAVPFDNATTPNIVLTMDYVEGFGDPLGGASGRKWNIWDISMNAMDFVLRPDTGHLPLFIGNNVSNGKIYTLDDDALNDDGMAINSYWQPGFFQQNTRLNFGYLLANIVGSGTCNLTMRLGNQQYLKQIRPWTLSDSIFFNMERQIQADGSRMSIVFGTNGLTDWFSLQGASIFVQPSAWSALRGQNSTP